MAKSRAEYLKVWRSRNKKKVQKYRRDWYIMHWAEQKERCRKYRAKKKGETNE